MECLSLGWLLVLASLLYCAACQPIRRGHDRARNVTAGHAVKPLPPGLARTDTGGAAIDADKGQLCSRVVDCLTASLVFEKPLWADVHQLPDPVGVLVRIHVSACPRVRDAIMCIRSPQG